MSTASIFSVGLLAIAAEALNDFSSVCTGECVACNFRDYHSIFQDPYLLRVHSQLHDKPT